MFNCSCEISISAAGEDKSAKPKIEETFKHNLNRSRHGCPGVGYQPPLLGDAKNLEFNKESSNDTVIRKNKEYKPLYFNCSHEVKECYIEVGD